jgi:pimeloyl-ACP methyl ester carboxylesterase
VTRKPRPALDDLIDRFEEDVRQRPTPDEVAAAERAEAAAASPKTRKRGRPKASQATAPRASAALPAEAATAAPPPPVAARPLRTEDLQTWWAGGERVQVELPDGRSYGVFARVIGDGPWLTLIHGFPTSSWDWSRVAPALVDAGRALLVLDLLGFGDSDKPRGHDWSAFEQADIIEALWQRFGVEQTGVVAHDVGLTVALELLARQGEGHLATRIDRLVALNGGAYAGHHRPRPIQVWLQRPLVGPLVARMLSEKRFGPALAEVFGPLHQPSAIDLHQHWLTVSRRGGSANYHRLIRYIPERRAHAPRWETALERTEVPVRFAWGMADPVSGAHMAKVIRERRPGADLVELPGVGHYPQLEAPERVAEAILG